MTEYELKFHFFDGTSTIMYTNAESREDALAWAYGLRLAKVELIEARPTAHSSETPTIPYGYQMWGGQLRDALPHGRRWYMNGGRW